MLNPKWGELPHAAIPELLKGTIRTELAKGKNKAFRVADIEAERSCARAVSAAVELSKLMITGYATRVVADYQPEIQIIIDAEQECFLNSIGAKEAKNWSNKSAGFVNAIVTAWSQIND